MNDTSFKKYRLWKGIGSNTSARSRLGLEIEANNKNPRNISRRELEAVTTNRKMFNAMYFWPLPNILEIMARNGKIDGVYLNLKQGWHFHGITHDEIKMKNKMNWKVRYEKYEDFLEDIEMIKEYRIYYTNRNTDNEETIKCVNDMLRDEWTMNVIDGNVTRKQIWHKYRSDCIKVMNLEFRLKDDIMNTGTTETPIVFCEDNGEYNIKKYDERKLQLLENKWTVTNGESNIPNKKKKKQIVQKNKDKTKKIRVGTEEVLEEMREIKKLLMSYKENPINKGELVTLDKFDQMKEVERMIFDDEVKEKMMQVILSRQDTDDLQYKVLEEKLLSGANYTIRMPKVEVIRTNILGMVQEIDNNAPEKWSDINLEQRLQKITGIRMKKLINHKLQEIVQILLTYRNEIEMVNDLKSQCETKTRFDLKQFTDLLRQTVGEKEYSNERVEFMDRWCDELEKNIERGTKPDSNITVKQSNDKALVKKFMECRKRRFEISSDSEDSFNVPRPSKMAKTSTSNGVQGCKNYNEEIVISSESCRDTSNSESSSDIIPREKITYLLFSSEDES